MRRSPCRRPLPQRRRGPAVRPAQPLIGGPLPDPPWPQRGDGPGRRGNPSNWSRITDILGHPKWRDDPRFQDARARRFGARRGAGHGRPAPPRGWSRSSMPTTAAPAHWACRCISTTCPRPPARPRPTWGQQTVNVLGEAGFDRAEIDALLRSGVVHQHGGEPWPPPVVLPGNYQINSYSGSIDADRWPFLLKTAVPGRTQAGSGTSGLPYIGSSFLEAKAWARSIPSAWATPAP